MTITFANYIFTINESKFHGLILKLTICSNGLEKASLLKYVFAAGANPEEMMNYDLSRSAGLISKDAQIMGLELTTFM